MTKSYYYHWIKKNGSLPKGHHLHHIVAKFRGGSDALSNIVCLSVEDHANAHLVDYYLYGDVRDLRSYALILKHRTNLDIKPWNKGLSRSEETKRKVSETKRLKSIKPPHSKPVLDTTTGVFHFKTEFISLYGSKLWNHIKNHHQGLIKKNNTRFIVTS